MSTSTPASPRLYSVSDVADLLGIGRTLAYSLLQHGQLESVKIGRRRLVAHDDLVAYIENMRANR